MVFNLIKYAKSQICGGFAIEGKPVTMKKMVLSIFVLAFLFACSNNKVRKISWEGNLIGSSAELNYLFWRDGNQHISQKKDSVIIRSAGFELKNSVYVLVSLTNETTHPVTFFINDCKLQYTFEGQEIVLSPVKPKNMNESHFSLVNSLIGSAGNISRLFINVPVDMFLNFNKNDSNTPSKFSEEYQDDNNKISHKIFINNHTLFPGTNYTGFIVFEYERSKSFPSKPFNLLIKAGNSFDFSGRFGD